jgi:hypothetical protein
VVGEAVEDMQALGLELGGGDGFGNWHWLPYLTGHLLWTVI